VKTPLDELADACEELANLFGSELPADIKAVEEQLATIERLVPHVFETRPWYVRLYQSIKKRGCVPSWFGK